MFLLKAIYIFAIWTIYTVSLETCFYYTKNGILVEYQNPQSFCDFCGKYSFIPKDKIDEIQNITEKYCSETEEYFLKKGIQRLSELDFCGQKMWCDYWGFYYTGKIYIKIRKLNTSVDWFFLGFSFSVLGISVIVLTKEIAEL